MTASVRFVTFNALRMAVTWCFTVGSATSRAREIALLLFPSIMRASTSIWRSVKPRSAGEAWRTGTGSFASVRTRASGGM
jgi:hypothetical protein